MKYFITAIGTGCGKTLVSSIFTEALNADYWKPIQTGKDDRDLATVKSLVSNHYSTFHPEQFWLDTPASPHAAAEIQNLDISLSDFKLPITENNLIIEGAGGVLVPLNYKNEYVIDFAKKFDCEIVLVSNYYLGSINHTLLTFEFLKSNNFKIKGIVFNGNENIYSKKAILTHTKLPILLEIPQMKDIQKKDTIELAHLLNINLKNYL